LFFIGGIPLSKVELFRELALSEERLAAVEALGWIEPTPIQWKAIPPGLEGVDIVGVAQTGTGKTGAFMIPCLERISVGGGLQVLVLCPTRELAQQVEEDTHALAKGTAIRSASIVGGVSYGPQEKALNEGAEIIVATPGRLIDHMGKGRVPLGGLKTLILDEADRMLDMGFRPQIEEVRRGLRNKPQIMLFSATMPNGVHALALQLTKDPVWLEAAPSGTKADGITEVVYSVKPEKKPDLLLKLLEESDWNQVLVFCRTKAGADTLKARLGRAGISADAMHSDRQMRHRTKVLEDFSEGKIRVLVATDIAQRGLDVDGITHVVNYDVPLDPEDYVHRIGRTGRAGATGTAVTFLTAADLGAFKSLEYHLGRPLDRIHLPDFDYSGAPIREDRPASRRGASSRAPLGMGSRLKEDLDSKELDKILKLGRDS
jgi:ATP-dependent RNA helicase RhlE